jgi:hypothetical protein
MMPFYSTKNDHFTKTGSGQTQGNSKRRRGFCRSWMQPPRHALGALLLEQGQIEEAAAVFSADLAAHPGGNVWALHGLTECEERVSENELLSTFCVKRIALPRQAPDKHKGNSKTEHRFYAKRGRPLRCQGSRSRARPTPASA